MSVERWVPVPGHPRYEVSDAGRVRNAVTGRVLQQQPGGKGGEYRKVHLGRSAQRLVHRLVCEAFHGPPPNPTDHADHGNFITTDNRPSNLRWLSATLNSGRQVRWGAHGWERLSDEDRPVDAIELTDEQRAQLDDRIAAAGW